MPPPLPDTPHPRPPTVLRPPAVGELSLVVHRQSLLYAQEHGWDSGFEALASRIVADFIDHLDPARERCWVAEQAGRLVGSVFVVRGDDAGTAKLRMLYVDACVRGQGLGRQLVDTCLLFAQQSGYQRITLWTNSVLVAARGLYQATGFTLQHEAPHHSFGHDLVGQVWARDL